MKTSPKSPPSPPNAWVVLPSGTNAFDTAIRHGALEYAFEHGFNRIRLADEAGIRTMLRTTPAFRERTLALIAHLRTPELLKAVHRYRIPSILLGEENVSRWRKQLGGSCTVCSIDNESIGTLAADYLVRLGRYRSYVYADGSNDKSWRWWCQRRFDGFAKTLRELHQPAPVRCGFLNRPPLEDMRTFERLVKILPGPVAVFACNDQVAREVMTACRIAKIPVPDEVGILGADDDDSLCKTAPIPLSTVRADQVRLGRLAMALLLRRMNGFDERNRTILCPPLRIVERTSTHVFRASDPAVERARAFIASATPHAITVDQVVSASGAPKNYILKQFRRETGLTILKAIQSRALDAVRTQLLDTDLTNTAIANRNGFSSVAVLCMLFRRRFGMTMKTYRRQHRLTDEPPSADGFTESDNRKSR